MGKGFDKFMENPYWREIYENAPSDNLKRYYELMFDHNSFDERSLDEVEDELRELKLVYEDVAYLRDNAPQIPQLKIYYSKCLQAIEKGPEGCGLSAISFVGEIRNPDAPPKD